MRVDELAEEKKRLDCGKMPAERRTTRDEKGQQGAQVSL
jgi:hypothetical protein